ncbi:hypothetical protein HYFRA_00008664 [Hymenoscyphus fraxineus]|uniref:Uncharacterized protein n=1 Tax=Hymenoscyphus fraxineus TaxID=746836 RepID=A0A9N9KZJ2_9HELO|nr:hypothetical protein HYFRA_00008664 [Hymenoscyphus fraxineus]
MTSSQQTMSLTQEELARIESNTTVELAPGQNDAEAYFQKQIEESVQRELKKPPTVVERFVAFFTTPFVSLSGRQEMDVGEFERKAEWFQLQMEC